MKKLLLFGLALGLAFGGYAQKTYRSSKEFTKNNTERRADASFEKQTNPFQPKAVDLKSGNAVMVDRYTMGKSGNAYGVITPYQRAMFYDPASGAIAGSFRSNPADHGTSSSGSMVTFISPDFGPTFNFQVLVDPDGATYGLRYPSGVIYNPDGNTNVEELFTVGAGPSHTGGTWNRTYHAVAQMNNTNKTVSYYDWEGENDWARSNMTVVPNAVFNFGQDYQNIGDLGVNQTMKQYVGTTDDPANGFTWEYNAVTPDWLIDAADGHSVALYTTWAAFSKDGSIGYMWLVGVSNDSYDYGVYQPQIFVTEDGGSSWDEVELNLEDHPTLVEFLPPWEDGNGNPGTVRPSFLTGDRTSPGVVDYMGRLHLFSNVYGSSTGDALSADEGNWIIGDVAGGHIFDFVIDPTGVQDVIFVDSIMTEETAATAFGDMGWDHRLQVSKSVDEKVIFAVWADDLGAESGTVLNPDIKAWGYSAETGIHTDAVNFTETDLYAGFYFYHYVAEFTPDQNGFYNIPISTSITPGEFGAQDPLSPITNTFVSGIGFSADLFIGVEDGPVAQNGNITVAQNQPNPFTGTTIIQISSKTIAPVSVEVANMLGQVVYTQNAGTINGTMNVELNASQLEAGVYFYTVRVGADSVTKKMIVE